MNHSEKLVATLAHVARPTFEGMGLRPDCCVAATRAGLDVLEAWGIKARPVLCEAVACNIAFRAGSRDPATAFVVQIDAGINIREGEREMREHASETGLLGHVIIAAKVPGRHMLIDLSAYQFDRPSRGIHVPNALAFDSRGSIALRRKWDTSVELKNGGMMLYRPHPAPELAPFREARDWMLPSAQEQATHREVVGSLKAYAAELMQVATFA